MDYKDTLLMPKTEFSMRGNLPENEKLQREAWKEQELYTKIKEKNKGGKSFVLHDGPPYANGPIHMGHAFNKIIKDFINRSKMMEGYYVEYIPGWDAHGLPIEQAVTNSGVNRKEMSVANFRDYCKDFALEQIEIQKEGFKELNVIGDWDNPYITLSNEFEAKQIEVFAAMAKKGLIFKGLKPVYWSPSSETALAEAEIEYRDRKDPSVFVTFEVKEGNEILTQGDNLVIWTTTPWTLPGNTAVAIGEDIEYSLIKVNDNNYVIATELLEDLARELEFTSYTRVKTFKGIEINGIKYKHPFMERISPVVLGHHVTLEAGTGLVHIAPAYGEDDFIIGKQYDLEMVNGVNDQGILTEESGRFKGLLFEEANKEITKWLDENGYLLKLKFITHSYPHDWRTRKPIIFRATKQWFCSVEEIREEILNQIENNITWKPTWGKTRLHNMIESRGDWCISRQRAWGVPIPIFYNEDGSEIVDYDVMMHVAKLFREFGSNVWFEREANELLPKGYTNPNSPNGNFTKETDIMDVWFDSGSSHTSVLIDRGFSYPADVYFEGSDQYRGWFNSSLITGVAVHGTTPYKTLLSHGFLLDGKGLKMSKSGGNGVDPLDIVKNQGSDILRLWASSVDFTEDMAMSDEIMSGVKESYRKLRNTYRFMLGNLFDFSPKNKVPYDKMPAADKYQMICLNKLIKEVKDNYNTFDYQENYKLFNNFIASLSTFYLDFTKDILYIDKDNSLERRSVQTVLYETLYALIRLTAPILPYTSEEVYALLPGDKLESVHLENMPKEEKYKDEVEIQEMWGIFFGIKDDVYKALEEARNEKIIGKSLEAKVYLNLRDEDKHTLKQILPNLKQLLIVSEVVISINEFKKYDYCGVEVQKFEGHRCERCWNYFTELDMSGDICLRCEEVLGE